MVWGGLSQDLQTVLLAESLHGRKTSLVSALQGFVGSETSTDAWPARGIGRNSKCRTIATGCEPWTVSRSITRTR